ncbi:MAG: hypothetical protein K2Q20_08055, partial [Phycisphaerales bacterium]|nr:hypothetical protein [Phycisphaerales bacterium]
MYDDAGRVIEERDNLGTRTKTDYDGLGRVIRTRVTPFGQPNSTVTTRYGYENGRLRFMGAERHGSPHALDSKPRLSVTEWTQASKYLQVTELVYNKYEQNNPTPRPDWVVIDPATPNAQPISDNYDWPVGVRLPRGFCLADFNGDGAVAVDDIFAFLSAWFANGPGSDANGDGIRNVTDIFFFLGRWFAGSGGCGDRFQFGEDLDITFRYTIDGLLAERTERVNVNESNRIRYTYDTLGRRTQIIAETVDQSGNPIPPLPTAPVGMLAKATYRFDPLDRLVEATALAAAVPNTSSHPVIAQSRFNYDGWGRLLSEKVAHGETLQSAAAGARTISYAWSGHAAPGAASSGGPVVRRLESMTLPWQAPTSVLPIAIGYDYGQASPPSTNHLLSRVQSIWLGVPGGTSQAIAAFNYIGASTRSSLILGPVATPTGSAVEQTLAPGRIGGGSDGPPIVSGLDRFGRPTHLRYDGPAASLSGPRTRLWESRMAYDGAGRRVMDRIWLGAPETGQTEALGSDRSWAYAYDNLGRLTGAVSGRIHDPAARTFGTGNVDRRLSLAWNMDELGNLRQSEPPANGLGEPADFGRVRTLFDRRPNTGGVMANRPVEVVSSGHVVNTRNQLEALDFAKRVPPYPNHPGFIEPEPTIRTTLPTVYDAPGRLRFDGSRVLDYDALGRLVRIRAAGGLQAAAFGTPQAPAEPS